MEYFIKEKTHQPKKKQEKNSVHEKVQRKTCIYSHSWSMDSGFIRIVKF